MVPTIEKAVCFGYLLVDWLILCLRNKVKWFGSRKCSIRKTPTLAPCLSKCDPFFLKSFPQRLLGDGPKCYYGCGRVHAPVSGDT